MVAMFGKLEEFDMATGKDWIQYIGRMEYYFQANKITGDAKRAVLISAMGEKACLADPYGIVTNRTEQNRTKCTN